MRYVHTGAVSQNSAR